MNSSEFGRIEMDASVSEKISSDYVKLNSAGDLLNGKEPAIYELLAISDEKDGDTEDENDYEEQSKDNYEVLNGTNRTVTLQTLMNANILQAGKSLMTIDYLGQKFVGDLMADGKIKSQETETLFLTPSAWAMHCKRIINPEKKSGCGWASVKYKGKKLDAYKNSWLRKCALQKGVNIDDLDSDVDKKADNLEPIIKRNVYLHNTVAGRNLPHDGNSLIKAVPFTSVGKVQPFLVEFNSSALLLADFHCHLTMKEVCGYFGGHWDINTHTLTIKKAYPCRSMYCNSLMAAEEEHKIKDLIFKDQLLLVGWYHSHPKFQAEPSLRDCDTQMDFQIRMRGCSDVTYTPCISTIISPYYDGNPTLESVIRPFWVMPPTESKQMFEYGRPMLMLYSVLLDIDATQSLRWELQECAEYYFLRNEFVKFSSIFTEDITFIEKLKSTLHSKLPVIPNNTTLWNWICKILGCGVESEFVLPNKADKNEVIASCMDATVQCSPESLIDESGKDSYKEKSIKAEKSDFDKKGIEIKVMSLQEQLCLPSGLNMNPIRTFAPLATPNLLVSGNISSLATANSPTCQTTANAVVQSKQSDELTPLHLAPKHGSIIAASSTLPIAEVTLRDSPITVSSSPVKSSEVPMQSPPSPLKSETSFRSQNSPKESSRNSNNITQSNLIISKTDTLNMSKPLLAIFPSASNDLVAASLAQLAGQIAPNFLQTDISSLFPQHLTEKNYANSSINQLISENRGEEKNESVLRGYSKDISSPRVHDSLMQNQDKVGNSKPKTDCPRLSLPPNFSSNASNIYKTKLMKELDNIKNDPLKINELIRSPEYASLLLHQAEALGATTLGTLGLGSDLNFLTGNNLGCKENPSQHADYNNLVTASKILEYESCVQQEKLDDLDRFLQQQIGAVAAAALVNVSLSSGTVKKQTRSDSQPQTDYNYLLETYSKLFEVGNNFRDALNEGKSVNKSQNDLTPSRIQQKQNESQNHMHNSLFYQGKTTSDLSTFFATSSTATNLLTAKKLVSSNANSENGSVLGDSAMYYNAFPQDKIQDYSYLQQQHGKGDSNIFISPANMMKIQKDSLSTMMMKPPKSTSATISSFSRTRETSTSPALGRLTPTKSGVTSPGAYSSNSKYNFSAVDLAVSSIQPNTSILVSLEAGNASVSLRKPSNTPPVDLSSFINECQSPSGIGSIKKRMEFSSIAELAAPPPSKLSKGNGNSLF